MKFELEKSDIERIINGLADKVAASQRLNAYYAEAEKRGQESAVKLLQQINDRELRVALSAAIEERLPELARIFADELKGKYDDKYIRRLIRSEIRNLAEANEDYCD